MSKILINEVKLGKKCVGFEMYNTETKDMVGMTSKMIKDSIEGGDAIIGFKLDDNNELAIDKEFCKNIMVKSGISTYVPKWEGCKMLVIYTVVGKQDANYEVVSSSWFHGEMSASEVETFYKIGAVNGLIADSKGKLEVYLDNKNTDKKDKEEITADKIL